MGEVGRQTGEQQTEQSYNMSAFDSDSNKLLWIDAIFADSMSFFSSSTSRFNFARRFWNHVMTCAPVSPSAPASSSLSAGDRYFWYRKRFSNSKIWWFVNAVRDLRFFFGGWRLLKRFM